MTRLLRVEFRRLLRRRLFRLLILAMFLTVATIIVVNGVLSNRNFAAARAKAAAEANAALRAAPIFVEGSGCSGRVTFEQAPDGTPPGPALNHPCLFYSPNAQDFYADPRFSFAFNATHLVIAGVALASIVGFVVGAGFIGAEWAAGTFPLLLTWEPRRRRVLVAKLTAVVVTLVAVGVLTVAVLVAGGWVIAATRGTTAHVTPVVWHNVLWYSLRGLALVALLSSVGVALAGLTRHTAAALVGAIGYLVVFEIVVRHLHPQWERWLLTTNAGALLGGSVRVLPEQRFAFKFTPQPAFVLHADRAGLYLGVLAILMIASWVIALVRRDVDDASP
jgi:ABC-type transport system involved in multi-copper enzyme maturation permease subunit